MNIVKINQKLVSGIKGGEGSVKQKNKKIKYKKKFRRTKKKKAEFKKKQNFLIITINRLS